MDGTTTGTRADIAGKTTTIDKPAVLEAAN
jgi:hypothetical protein